jgi:hypothetical protein
MEGWCGIHDRSNRCNGCEDWNLGLKLYEESSQLEKLGLGRNL